MKLKLNPYVWGVTVMAASLALSLWVAAHEKTFAAQQQITSPGVSLAPVLLYFFGVVAAVALVLFFIPVRYLQLVFRLLFGFMFAWGIFILIYFIIPGTVSLTITTAISWAIGIIAALCWLFFAKIWLHNILLLVALSSAGATIGFLFSPLTFMIFMLVIALYDFLAVRFGFMVWMADKMSGAASLPAFVFPKKPGDVALNLKEVQFDKLRKEESDKREHTILGGGDIGFPLMLSGSVFFKYGLPGAILVGGLATLGLMEAFIIQKIWLKGKPMPALPPIALMSLIGYLIVVFVTK